jgi:tetratricopeptide (TPR) repeat protein
MRNRTGSGFYLCAGPLRHAWVDPTDAARCCNGYTRVRSHERVDDGTYRLVFAWVPSVREDASNPDTIPSTGLSVSDDANHSVRLQLVTDNSDEQVPKDPNVPVRHLAFFRAASKAGEGSDEYRMLLAGLLVLRLIDKLSAREESEQTFRFQEFIAVKREIESLSEGPAKRLLSELLSTVTAFVEGTADSRAPKMIAYAEFLEEDLQWAPAADAYLAAMAIIRAQSVNEDLLPLCCSRAGYCFRETGELERAEELYRDGFQVATDLADEYWAFRLRISIAMLALHKGDLPSAELQLDRIIADATSAGAVDALARAQHNRGMVAEQRRQFERAAAYFYAAVNLYTEERQKQRALVDVAMALSSLGHLEYARKVYLAARKPESGAEIYALAGVNLMRIAVLAGDRDAFETLRTELAHEAMSGRVRAHYHLFAGEGFRRYGQTGLARASFEAAITTAKAYGVYKLVIEAEEMLNSKEARRPIPWKEPEAAAGLTSLFEDIDQGKGVFAGAT